MLQRLLDRMRRLWTAAKAEHASPAQIGVSVGIGTACCLAPILGFHIWVALALSTLLRTNRLWAAFASQAPSLFGLLRAPIVFAEIQLAHRVRTGGWAGVPLRSILEDAPWLLADWLFGSIPIALTSGVAAGVLAYVLAKRRVRRTPAPPLPPTSGSPPSGPPAPHP